MTQAYHDTEMTTYCLVGGEKVRIEAEAIIGHYAIHKRIRHKVAVGPGWTVTHRTTGGVVWVVENYDDALRIANYLLEKNKIPAGLEETDTWKRDLLPQEKAHLLEELTLIAPRLPPL